MVYALLARVSALLGTIGDEGQRPPHEADILALFDRVRSLHAAARLLLESGFVHEAMILVRPLFTDSLVLAELAASDDALRAELIVRWRFAGLADLEAMFHDLRRDGADVSRRLAWLKEQRTMVSDYARRHGARSTKHWRPDRQAKELAVKHGRDRELLGLLVAHGFVHGSATVVSQRITPREGGVAIGAPAAQVEPWFTGTALFAASSAVHAARATFIFLGRVEPQEVTELLDEIERLYEA